MVNLLKRTALFDHYSQYGGKTVDFGGWELPVQFSGIKAEHQAVRMAAGLFDVSHMGEIAVSGAEALPFLQKMVTNDVSKLKDGQVQYTVMCKENGGTVDDFLIYRRAADNYLLVVNAANTEKDLAWLNKHRTAHVRIEDRTASYALLACQGPLAEQVLQKLTDESLEEIGFFRFKENVTLGGEQVLLSRTGYTGEDGFEIYGAPDAIARLWPNILKAGEQDGIVPAGLGARDTLRFEAGLPLYGQELTEDISPLEAGLGFVVKLAKGEFIGRKTLFAQREDGILRKIVGLEMVDRGIPRTGYKVFGAADEEIGQVTTGTQSPTLNKNVGFSLLQKEYAVEGTEVFVEVREKKLKAVVVQTPFYRRA